VEIALRLSGTFDVQVSSGCHHHFFVLACGNWLHPFGPQFVDLLGERVTEVAGQADKDVRRCGAVLLDLRDTHSLGICEGCRGDESFTNFCELKGQRFVFSKASATQIASPPPKPAKQFPRSIRKSRIRGDSVIQVQDGAVEEGMR
jgi:hypothetical protein